VLPLTAAPLCFLMPRGRLAWLVALVVSWLAFAIALVLLAQTLEEGVVSYAMGGWQPPIGIEYRVDPVNAIMLLIVAGTGALMMPYARTSVEREIPARNQGLFYTAYLLCLTGLLGIAITGDAFNVFVFLEISSLSTYALISLGRDRRALTAAYQYLIMGTIGATFILIGIGMLYMMTGTLNMADLAMRVPQVADTRTVQAAFAFLTVGISLKLALFPLHLWLPNAYAFAPSVVTAFLAATATKVAVYLLLRFFFTVFGAWSFETLRLDWILMPLALVGIVSASVVAIFESDVKRMLAYSSVAQIGYMILGIRFGSVLGVTAGILHLFNHALMKGALFLALGCVAYRLGSVELTRLAGLGRQMPWTMAAFVVAGLSLVGVPLTAGFVSKWYLVLGALEHGWWPVALLVLLTSLLALAYIWRVVEVAYFRAIPESSTQIREAPLSLLIPTWVLAAANLLFGIDASLTTQIAGRAAGILLGAGP
ncbi:MAG: monovalent cation/H+ antiporter subunit D family protein, partial [Candidatus Competibacteraceae bacterium]|nr:monovalent cation/H+ antiporter subunit D family protein [Candidatus Competibacteraceae bacterium]